MSRRRPSWNEHPVSLAGGGELETVVGAAREGSLAHAEALIPERAWPTDPYASRPSTDRYRVARDALGGELDLDHAVAELKSSNLRGMGGAGFPTGLKWGLVRAEAAEPKYVICNADESEPGTFKDRQILAELPHLVLEACCSECSRSAPSRAGSSSDTSTSPKSV